MFALLLFIIVHNTVTKPLIIDNAKRFYQHILTEQRNLLLSAIQHQDWALIRNWVTIESESEHTENVLFVSSDYKIIASTKLRYEGKTLGEYNLELLDRLQLQTQKPYTIEFYQQKNDALLDIFVPIDEFELHSQNQYWLILTINIKDELFLASNIFWRNILLYLLSMAFTALCLFYLIKIKLTHRLSYLEQALQCYLDGDHKMRLPEYQHHEFNRLETLINDTFNLIENEIEHTQTEQKYSHLIIESSNDGIISINQQGQIINTNQRAATIFGYKKIEELVGSNIMILIPAHFQKMHNESLYHANNKKAHQGILNKIREVEGRKKDGSCVPIELTITESSNNDEKFYVAFIKDVTEAVAYKNSIEKLAFIDQLTGLLNVNGLKRKIASVSLPCTMNLIDFDSLKLLNDSFGVQFGDKIIQSFAKNLATLSCENLLIIRIKAGRFILLTQSDKLSTQIELNSLLNKEVLIDKIAVRISFCCCQSELNHSDEINEKIQQSEVALRDAKQHGRGSFIDVNLAWVEMVKQRAQLCQQLEHAIEQHELFFYFQPKYNALTHQPASAEALIRWKLNNEFISPSTFIPLAEQSHLMPEIDRFVIEKSCETIRFWLNQGLTVLPISINLSSRYLFDDKTISYIFEKVGEYDVPAHLLEIEVTEYGLIEDFESTALNMRKLQKAGIKVAIDDYGTGHSNLQTILILPIEHLKIDQSFIRLGMTDKKGQLVLENILQLAKSLEVEITAEGVETAEQLAFLAKAGCHYIQGYYFSKPLSQLDFEQLLAQLPQVGV